MFKAIILPCAVALCGLSAMPAQAAPCDTSAFKENNNKKGHFNVWVRNHSSNPDWVYVKRKTARPMPTKYAKALEITFDGRKNPSFSLELRRTGLSKSNAIFCNYNFSVGSKGREFTLESGACAQKNGGAVSIAEIDCSRSYSYKANRMTMKLTIKD